MLYLYHVLLCVCISWYEYANIMQRLQLLFGALIHPYDTSLFPLSLPVIITKFSQGTAYNNNSSLTALYHVSKNCLSQGDSSNSVQIQKGPVYFQGCFFHQRSLCPGTIIDQDINLQRNLVNTEGVLDTCTTTAWLWRELHLRLLKYQSTNNSTSQDYSHPDKLSH